MTCLRNELEGTLPADASERIERNELMRLVFEAVHETNWPAAVAPSRDATPEPTLRTVLTYCYACSIFSSAEIEAAARHEEAVRYLCAKDIPEFEEIRKFRRRAMPYLRESLARVLYSIWNTLNADRMPLSFLAFVSEADHRLACAVEADSAAMDD
jgi:transposase